MNYVMTRRYFSQRAGRTPDKITFDHLKKIVGILYRKFKSEGYFQYNFGYDCVDTGKVPGKITIGLEEQLILTFGSRGELINPDRENGIENFTLLDFVFDLIEFLHDYIAKPTTSEYHTYNNCGLHVSQASSEEGQIVWRDELNKSLNQLDPPYRITSVGNIEGLPPSEGLQNLVDNYEIPSDDGDIDTRIKHSCNMFLKHGSSIEEKRDAIKNLADVLEFLRSDLKDYIPGKEEGELFNIANNFGIRHHKQGQKIDYNHEAYFPWIFYSYLATVDLLTKLKNSQS